MIDFHSHILPSMDDGAEDVRMSLRMLRESARQGVDVIFATPHFYADQEDPATFLKRRTQAYETLMTALAEENIAGMNICLGAEILYFPGMCGAEELCRLKMGSTPCLLIEPPMMPWSDTMLDEIEQTGKNLRCIPVIAHIDRFMRMLGDYTLFDRVKGRRLLIQVNASFFLHSDTAKLAVSYLQRGSIQFIGSDCHDMDMRAPNIGKAASAIRDSGAGKSLSELNRRVYCFLDECGGV